MKRNLFIILALISASTVWAWTSETGHTLYFENYNGVWSNVYLRIEGGGSGVQITAFTRITGTDWWKCSTPSYGDFTKFTITDNSSTAASLPSGSNRTYEYGYNIDKNHWFVINPDGKHSEGSIYWWETSDTENYPNFRRSQVGHQVWFDNSNSKWSNVYLRIGRSEVTGVGEYTSTWPMTRVDDSDLWYVNTENWENAEAWTITDVNTNNGDYYSPFELPSGANRLYFYNDNIDHYVMYKADGTSADGTDEVGAYWWNNSQSSNAPAVPGCTNCFFVGH